MIKSLILTKRECVARVKTKGFVIGTLLAPVLLFAMMFAPMLFMRAGNEGERTIAVVDLTRRLLPAMEQYVSEQKKDARGRLLYRLEPEAVGAAGLDSIKNRLNRRVRQGRIDAFLVIPEDVFESNRFDLYLKSVSNITLNESIDDMVSMAVTKIRLNESGLDADLVKKLNRHVKASTFKVEVHGAKKESGEVAVTLTTVLAMLIYLVFIFYGSFVIRGVIEDKNSHVIEVLLSSVRPHQIMAGKILGIGLSGLIQIGVWALCALLVSTYGLAVTRSISPAAQAISMPSLSVWVILSLVLFFLIGYFMYSAVYAALGSLGNTDADIQNLQWPAMSPILVSMFLMFAILKNPDGNTAVVLSLIPIFSPILMFVRISAHAAPLGQVLVCIALCLLTITGLVWIAGRIFRVGVLMYGKRPTLPEVLKWIRYS